MPIKNQNNHQDRIDQEVDKVLAQNEDWEETYGRLFEKKGKKKEKFSGGTLAAEKKRLEENRYYARQKTKPPVKIKIKRK